jgi:hypothetical protein
VDSQLDARSLRTRLCELARGEVDVASLRAGPGWEVMRDAAIGHGLATMLAHRLEVAGLDVDAELRWVESTVRARRLAARRTLHRLAFRLGADEPAWAVVKGPVVATAYPRPADREFNDLDLLVSGADLGEVLDVLGTLGMEELNHNWVGFTRYGVAELPVQDGVTRIDLHWHLVGRRHARRRFAIDTAELLGRARSVELGGGLVVPALDPVDGLVHVALHAGLSGGGRLSWLLDVAALVAAEPVDADELVRRCERMRVRVLVAHVLDRARRIVGADVDRRLVRELAPRSALVARRSWDRRPVPIDALPRKMAPALPVAMGRDGYAATLGATAEAVAARFRQACGRPHRWDVEDPESPIGRFTDAGGQEGRAAYLQMAAGDLAGGSAPRSRAAAPGR